MSTSIKEMLQLRIANAPPALRPILDGIVSDLESSQGDTASPVVYTVDPGQEAFEELSAWLKNIGISVTEGRDRKNNYFLILCLSQTAPAVPVNNASAPVAVQNGGNQTLLAVLLGGLSCVPWFLSATTSTNFALFAFIMLVWVAMLMVVIHDFAPWVFRRTPKRCLPQAAPAPALPQEQTFGIGATRAQVQAIQGGPMSVNSSCNEDRKFSNWSAAERWMYTGISNDRYLSSTLCNKDLGKSWLDFDKDGRLFAYCDYGDLRIFMGATGSGHFGIGSSKKEVLSSEGTPLSVDYRSKYRAPYIVVEVWIYKCHTIWFGADGKVAIVDTSEPLPILDAKIPHCDRFHPVR